MIRRLPLLGQLGIHRLPTAVTGSICPSWGRLLGGGSAGLPACPACICPSASGRGCWRHRSDYGPRGLTTVIIREPSFAASGSSSVGLHGDSEIPRLLLSQLHRPTANEEQRFLRRLDTCASSKQVFRLLRSVLILSDTMASAVLHRLADLEQEGRLLRDPAVLEHEATRTLCFQLEQDAGRLTDAGLASVLLACTRLFLDPGSSLMVRLVSESRDRLHKGGMGMAQLCTLGQAMVAMEGPGAEMLQQVMTDIQKRQPARWCTSDLLAVYKLLQSGVGEDGKYRDLLNAMHVRALSATSDMDSASVSGILDALVTLNQNQAMLLVIGLCKRAVQLVPDFADEELGLVLGALMHFGHTDPHFVEALERHVPARVFTYHPETLTKAVQFFSRRDILSPQVFDAVAESFVYRADDYSTAQVARQIMAFGKLGHLPPNAGEMYRKVENILHTRYSQFQPRMLLNLLHACILVERYPLNYVSRVFSSYFLQQLQEEEKGLDRIVLAQLTQLYMTVKLECPFYEGPKLLPQFRVNSFLMSGCTLESPVCTHLYNSVKKGLIQLLGSRAYFGSRVLTPYCYTLDVEIKVDEDGYVLSARQHMEVYRRIALCIDGSRRFTTNSRRLLGQEAIKQRHLRLVGYEVVQIPYYEFEELKDMTSVVQYLHRKIFPHTYRLSW